MIGELRGKKEFWAWAIMLAVFLILGLLTDQNGLVECFTKFASNLFDFIIELLNVLSEKIGNRSNHNATKKELYKAVQLFLSQPR